MTQAKPSPIVVEMVVKDGKFIFVEEFAYRTLANQRAKQWGDGAVLTLRIEPADDAISAAQRKYYFGYVIGPLVERTGYHKDEWHALLKADFFPDDGRTSITQLSHDEMRDYTARCEQFARERFPEAFAIYDNTRMTA